MTAPDARPRFDLQSHSDRSDGALTPAQVVRWARAAGVELLALTDHDTVSGVPEALTAARAEGIVVVPAVELSALDAGNEDRDLHVLGYGIDHRDPALLAALGRFRADRGQRAERMVAALDELGLHVDPEPLAARSRSGGSIGRPHLALAVLGDPRNAVRLRAEGLGDASEILEAYLLPGQPGYRGRTTPTVAEAIAAIHDAGGVAIWAHPFWDISDPAQVLGTIERFVALGLEGVEAFYVTHDRAQTLLVSDACERLGLLSTGSSDFHGPEHPLLSGFRAFSLYGREPRLGAIAAPPTRSA
jgi:3',5'-nucleoside bisphosphate phosphatase